ncbi:MAG: flagellar basal body L-ring protein FlgH [Alphaproteobacteria bacterium]|nr:flagellar basal body L-ring protein FlgH [Alphaproteobacteria bacterium]
MLKRTLHLPIYVLIAATLSGCNAVEKLAQAGQTPQLTQIRNPESNDSYTKVSMPMPRPIASEMTENSLWKAGARSFFKDQRAQDIGDILTIQISIQDTADMKNNTSSQHETVESASIDNVLGYEKYLNKVLPKTVDPSSLVKAKNSPSFKGSGAIKRSESLNVKIAAVVTQILPNGNLVVMGRQEVRVNDEVRELLITGIVRPQDILAENTISYEKIAEARISYGGRGHITNAQQPPWGYQALDAIMPF